jgi:hypothetical protein
MACSLPGKGELGELKTRSSRPSQPCTRTPADTERTAAQKNLEYYSNIDTSSEPQTVRDQRALRQRKDRT